MVTTYKTTWHHHPEDHNQCLHSYENLKLKILTHYPQYTLTGFFEGRRPTLMVRDPELIKLIMVRDFEYFMDRATLRVTNSPYIENMLLNMKGQQWKNVRALLTPTFSSGKLKAMKKLVEQCGKQMETFLQNQSK
jgi:cytochrome P450 family 6